MNKLHGKLHLARSQDKLVWTWCIEHPSFVIMGKKGSTAWNAKRCAQRLAERAGIVLRECGK